MVALLAQRYRLRVVGCSQADSLRAVGIDAQSQPLSFVPEGWLEIDNPFHVLPQLEG
jgi:hypothetical protein